MERSNMAKKGYNIPVICFSCCAKRENESQNLDGMTTSNTYETCDVLSERSDAGSKSGIMGNIKPNSSITLPERTGVIPSIEVTEWADKEKGIPKKVVVGFHRYGSNPAEDLEVQRIGGNKGKFHEITLNGPEDIGEIEIVIPTLIKDKVVNTKMRLTFGLTYARKNDKGQLEFDSFRADSIAQKANFENDHNKRAQKE